MNSKLLQKSLKSQKGLLTMLAMILGTLSAWSQITYNYTGSAQTYTVPAGVTSINISAAGAQGGGESGGGGLGASMSGDFAVTPGEILTIIVGQQGQLQIGGSPQNSSGGGGGTFVYDASNTLFIAAGGGGGKCNYSGSVPLHADAHGKTTADGGNDSSNGYLGGTGGNGGDAGLWSATPCAGGGTGWLTNGGGPFGGFGIAGSWVGGSPYCGGGGGGCGGYGGYGGGGGGGNHYGGGGGGGGYSGGGGGTDPTHGGGGGSYNIGTNQNNVAAFQTGQGVVTITEVVCAPTTVTPDSVSLNDLTGVCSVDTVSAPTATNDCGTSVNGVPDVAFPVTAVGTTVVTWTYDDGEGNTTTQTQNVIISGVNTNVTQAGATLTASATGVTYQWLNCDSSYAEVLGETGVSFTPSMLIGNYAVEINDGGCVDTSTCFLVDYTGVNELNSISLNVFPNPSADGVFTIEFDGEITKIQIIDILGRAVNQSVNFKNGKLDASRLNPGNYVMLIDTNKGTIKSNIVIMK